MNDLIIIGLITIVISVTVPIDTPINILDRLINSFNIRFNLLENGLQYYNYWSNWINVSLILLLFYTLYTISKLFYKWLLFTEIIEDLRDRVNVRTAEPKDSIIDYPNSWFTVFESSQLQCNEVKAIQAFGKDLIIFRGISGKAHILDAYCPHLGAHLAVGGTVVGDQIRCPFHGWSFNQNGICTNVPGLESSKLPKAEIKVWKCVEINDLIYVWYNSKGDEPNWYPNQFSEISDQNYELRGRIEYKIYTHLRDAQENAVDVKHFTWIHSLLPNYGQTKTGIMKLIDKIVKSEWTLQSFSVCEPPDQHISNVSLFAVITVFGFKIAKITNVFKLIGGSHILLKMSTKTRLFETSTYVLTSVIPMSPMCNKLVQKIYCPSKLLNKILAKPMIRGISKQLERDVLIFNNKLFRNKSANLTDNDDSIIKFRNWTNQFYPST